MISRRVYPPLEGRKERRENLDRINRIYRILKKYGHRPTQTDADLKDSLKVPKRGGMQENEPFHFPHIPASLLCLLLQQPAAHCAGPLSELSVKRPFTTRRRTRYVSSRVSEIRWHLQGAGL
jgi:hypothetical protein